MVNEGVQTKLQELLGKNYDRYSKSYFEIETMNHTKGPVQEFLSVSLFNKLHSQFDRLFKSLE